MPTIDGSIHLPHGEGFRFVDKKILAKKIGPNGVTVVCEHTFKGDEVWKAADHFPDGPIMPGMLILETMAQAALQAITELSGYEEKIFTFKSISEAHFFDMVKPDSILTISCCIFITEKERFGSVSGEAKIGDKLVADVVFQFAVVTNQAVVKKRKAAEKATAR
jgi:3-hydroxymyristoyl/3-hydroxydecanoyl-(acyl carrier protein) dehydratase